MTVAKIKPHLRSIAAPELLRSLPGWLMWRYEQSDGDKPRKVPYYINGSRRTGVQGRPEDRAQLARFEAARDAAARGGFDGIGFAPLPDFGVTAIDFDNCVADGRILPQIEQMISGTYAEWSPSGEGIHAFVRGDLGNQKDFGAPFAFELFSTKGFVTFTGQAIEIVELLGAEDTIGEPSSGLIEHTRSRFSLREEESDPLMDYAPPIGLTPSQIKDALDVLDPDMPRSHWLAIGMAIHHETGGEGFDLWHEWSARGSKYPGESQLRQQWKSLKRGDGKLVTARTLVKMANENGAHIRQDVASEADITQAKDDKPNRFALIPAHVYASAQSAGWLVKGVIPIADLVVLYGESGSGKSFLCLDIGAAVARGVPWRDHATRKGRVVYIVAEGAGGFRKRLAAYQRFHSFDFAEVQFDVIAAQPNFLEKADAVDVGRAILSVGKADLVIVDTFAQTMPGGNENSAEDMGKALRHCQVIRRATGAVVMLVHHSGKDATKGARGWSGLRAAADTEIEVLRLGTGRVARISKQKDGGDDMQWGFDLEVVNVGVDDDGDVIDSCVAVPAEIPVVEVAGRRRAVGKVERALLAVVEEMARAQSEGIEIDAVIAETAVRLEKPKGRDTRRQHVKRAIDRLTELDEAPFFVENGCLSMLV